MVGTHAWQGSTSFLKSLPKHLRHPSAKEHVRNLAARQWSHANACEIHQTIGAFWDFCPAWIARLSNDPGLPAAHAACDLAGAIRDGYPHLLRAPGDLLDAQEQLRVRIALSGFGAFESRRAERRRKDQEGKRGGK